MIASSEQRRICNSCRKRRPLSEFRRRYRDDAKNRHSECNTCRSAKADAKRQREHGKRMGNIAREIERRSNADAIMAIVEEVASQCGGFQAFGKLFAEMATDPNATPTRRFQAARAVLHMSMIVDCGRFAFRPVEERLRELPRRDLVRIVGELLDSNHVSLNEIDPPY